MANSSFERLDKCRLAIEMDVGGRIVQFCGTAVYKRHSELGPVLKIHVADPAGEFDVMLSEDRWKGKIEQDHRSGCDFRISLTTSDLCPHP
jgi:hypothetical protein